MIHPTITLINGDHKKAATATSLIVFIAAL